MNPAPLPIDEAAGLHPLLGTLIVCAILALVFFNRVPRLLLWMLGAAVLASLFHGDAAAGLLGNALSTLAGPLLTLGLIVLGLRIMTRGFRPRCRCCGEFREDCRCRGR